MDGGGSCELGGARHRPEGSDPPLSGNNLALLSSNLPFSGNNSLFSGNNLAFLRINLPLLSNNLPFSRITLPLSSANLPFSSDNSLFSGSNLPFSRIHLPLLSNNLPVSSRNLTGLARSLCSECFAKNLSGFVGSNLPPIAGYTSRKGERNVNRARLMLIGGILMLVAAAVLFVALDTDSSLPIAAGLAVVGIALVAVSRRRAG
jgi:hypothetical protein